MRRNIITVALFAVLSTMAVSCQKENLEELQLVTTETASARTIQYTIDGVEQIITLHGDEEWDDFVAQTPIPSRLKQRTDGRGLAKNSLSPSRGRLCDNTHYRRR